MHIQSNQERQALVKKWTPILEAAGAAPFKDQYRKEVTAVLLENQEKEMIKAAGGTAFTNGYLNESVPGTVSGSSLAQGSAGASTGAVAGYDPILINMVRRSAPQMIAYDICGVQPLTSPTGLIFAIKAKYTSSNGPEALFNEANPAFSGDRFTQNGVYPEGTTRPTGKAFDDAFTAGDAAQRNPASDTYGNGAALSTAVGEQLGGNDYAFGEMAFSIERTSVTAQTRALKAEFTNELAQDLQAVHGLQAEAELSNFLSAEILNEINRQVIRTVYISAKTGAEYGTQNRGIFDLDVDSNGRWSVEKFKGLLFQIEREANAIAQTTRRKRGNFIICSSDVASALNMAGVLDYAPALDTAGLNVDEASTTFAGVLNGKYKVFVDPYAANQSDTQFFVVGYKGTSAWDAGMFYCPYIPLEKVRATDPYTFQPKIGFKTRYGLAANPFTSLNAGQNIYYRKVKVANLM